MSSKATKNRAALKAKPSNGAVAEMSTDVVTEMSTGVVTEMSTRAVQARAEVLTSALQSGAGCLPAVAVERAEAAIAKTALRTSIAVGCTVVAFAGATGSGKSGPAGRRHRNQAQRSGGVSRRRRFLTGSWSGLVTW
jgi:hypothetical protein